jgi:hypothetical protein
MFSRDSGHNPILILGLFGLVAGLYISTSGMLDRDESGDSAIAQTEPSAQEFPPIAELMPEIGMPVPPIPNSMPSNVSSDVSSDSAIAQEPVAAVEAPPTPETKTMVGNQLRESPAPDAPVVGDAVAPNASIQTTGNTNGQWSEVIYNGITGWIAFE